VLPAKASEELIAEVVRKLDNESAGKLAGCLATWRCKAAVPALIKALDSMEFTEETQYDYHNIVSALRTLADPSAGPSLVRALEKAEASPQHMTPETRLTALDGLLRMGADFPAGERTLLHVIAGERRFSVFRMVALAGRARQSPREGLPLMLKELDAAPPTALPRFLEWLAATRLPGVVPTLKKHLNDRYAAAAIAAAAGLILMGDPAGLPVLHKLRSHGAHADLQMLRALMAYWTPETPADQVKLIRECLNAYPFGYTDKQGVTKEDYRQRFDLRDE
jgi:HEAT repeat protein